MPRRRIIGVIGGNKLPDVAALASDFGRKVASPGAILLTGGESSGPQNDVKNAAINGCAEEGGLAISVLPNGRRSCSKIPGQRRGVLQTGLSSFARDPITGAAADVIVVFRGGVGTLVELAYASFEDRPIIFCVSIGCLKKAQQNDDTELRSKLDEAVAGYRLIATNKNDLIEALTASFTSHQQRVEVKLSYRVPTLSNWRSVKRLPDSRRSLVAAPERISFKAVCLDECDKVSCLLDARVKARERHIIKNGDIADRLVPVSKIHSF
jgi:uncharacterized protein (TIGR00725 family)